MLEWILPTLVVALFSIIHFIEISAYFSRIAGLMQNRTAGAYALQNAVSMTTRFFMMALLPVIGLLVDAGIPKSRYLLMCLGAITGATLAGLMALALRDRIIAAFAAILQDSVNGRSLLTSLFRFPARFLSATPQHLAIDPIPLIVRSQIFRASAIVFSIYASSVFLVFYSGLLFPDYRTALSQLSGVTNAFAAVVLTFWIEPRISHSIDNSASDPAAAVQLVMSLIIGRVIGVFALAGTTMLAIYFSQLPLPLIHPIPK